jgi:hypothetical protein
VCQFKGSFHRPTAQLFWAHFPWCNALSTVPFLANFRFADDTGVRIALGIARFSDFQLDTAKSEAKAFQVIMLVSLLLLPAVVVIRFLTTFMNGTVFGLSNKCNAVSMLGECAVRISAWHATLF